MLYCTYNLLNLHLNNDQLHSGWQTILHIAKNNKFPTTLRHKLKHQIQHRIMHATPHTYAKSPTCLNTLMLELPTVATTP